MKTLQQIQQQALLHMEYGRLELGPSVSANPVSSYLDLALYEKEMDGIVKKRPLPWIDSSKVKNVGESYSAEFLGVPIIAVRDEQRKIRVYLNACRHRGAQLKVVKEEQIKLVCPFHGWSYSTNGNPSEIPERQNCFASVSSTAFRLKELPAYEAAGMIWIILSQDEFSFPSAFQQLLEDREELGFLPRHALTEKSFIANFNWKLGVEAFLEVYHFTHAHAPYLAQLQFPNLSISDTQGENCRIVVPLRKPSEDTSLLQWAQVMYFIFPSSFLLFYDDHVALISLLPLSINQTLFRAIPLVPSEASKTDSKIQQKIDFLEVIIGQDIEILEGIQKGLQCKANRLFTFTRLEYLLAKFHQDLHVGLSTQVP
ncbi:hypothetical protein AZI87_01675 [Bdellovibrio bacteriovorus]|uniref:Rieske domain-containing protein n=1 Tax=Bdellovibrio bacteriovorus TaxID=959 RepID=A0A162GFA8_BDEBC|nr:aromatic ring-hydroxylating dioxygenase subunit alpha [Bdellovibrio bacteriovorus]KYG68007.1 hypothetical protein AZI87_01675 [Bdellovibrio bacteriovorus]